MEQERSETERLEKMSWADYADALDAESWSRVIDDNYPDRARRRGVEEVRAGREHESKAPDFRWMTSS